MFKSAVAAAILLVTASSIALAGTVTLPVKGKPIATLTVPDDWTSSLEDDEYVFMAKDEAVGLAIGWASGLASETEMIAEAVKEFGKDAQIVPGSVKSKSDHINGMEALVTRLELRLKEGTGGTPMTITQIVMPKPDFVVYMILVNLAPSPEDEGKVDAIFRSLKLVD